ncbi:MAG: hypothetical protein QOE01_1217 [Actinomycetota bacterium]|jgi:hypothetical protein|nr:hypothetical protein [Actinomycetota bacterium]
MRKSRLLAASAATLLLAATATVVDASAGTAGTAGPQSVTRTIHKAGTASLARSSKTANTEVLPLAGPDAAEASGGPVANRSDAAQAQLAARTPAALSGIGASSSSVTSAPGGFNAINHHQQRLEVAGGNQWSLEPPDQALCVGNGKVFEAVNNAIAVYSSNGTRLAIDSLNHFFGYGFEIDRTKGVAGPQTTDPTCLYDPTTQRFFLTILTYSADAAGNPTGPNTLDTAVSSSSNPLDPWSIFKIDATDDGSNGTPNHPNCPCIGDYPHIGVDANGYYITTNEYPWFVDGFNGSQIYAMSKTKLAAGATSVPVQQFSTGRSDPNGNPGFTVWPAQSPTAAMYDTTARGTEYLMSTDAAEEANGNGQSSNIDVWSLTNTRSLNSSSAPALALRVKPLAVHDYAVPPDANQKPGPTPLADCLNLTSCAKAVWGTPDKFKEHEGLVAALDSRMQQVDYANGVLYAAHGTAVDVGSPAAQKAGVAWYIVDPTTNATSGNLSVSLVHQGRLAVADNNLVFPAMGVRENGSAVIGLTLAGADHYPSAAYVNLTAAGATGAVTVVQEGVGPADGFTEYRIAASPPRFGDYGAAAVDPATGHLWVATESIAQSCTFSEYLTAPLGQCVQNGVGTRTALANWSTHITDVG